MTTYFSRSLNYILKLESKIAFYPALLSFSGLIFAFLMFYIESLGISKYLLDNAPVLVVNDTETARSLLTTFIAGLISIMVFSFSMVMILLNQASSNFSPRILPGLISNRRHQVVLGIYNFTLLYCIFTLVSIEPNGNKFQLPGFSVLLAILGMTFCLAAFIYFIHSISQEIQVNNIMERIFEIAKTRLKTLLETETETETEQKIEMFDSSNWFEVTSETSGYFQDLDIELLKEIALSENLKLEVMPVKGSYIFQGTLLFRSSKTLDEALSKQISKAFLFSRSELVEDNYLLAFKQITEVAVKAMSPGINDPGTAINAIDYLTELFVLRLQKNDVSLIYDENNTPLVRVHTVDYKELLFQVMASLRTYCSHDIIIVQKLFFMLNLLRNSNNIKLVDYKQSIDLELNNLFEDASENLKNKADLLIIKELHSRSSINLR